MRPRYDYARKKFTPPVRRGRPRRRPLGRYLASALAVSFIVIGVTNIRPIISRLPIHQIQVLGTQFVPAEPVVALLQRQFTAKRWAVFPQRIAFFFNAPQAEKKLQAQFPAASWTVRKNWLGRLTVTVHERTPQLTWLSPSGAYAVDAAGVAFAVVPTAVEEQASSSAKTLAVVRPQTAGVGWPVVADESRATLQVGQQPLPAPVVAFVRAAAAALQAGSVDLPSAVIGFRYHPQTYRLTAETAAHYEIYFASDQPLSDQLAKLRAVLAQGVTKQPGVKYLDLRFGQKVYYR